MRTIKQDNAIAKITQEMMADAVDGKPDPNLQAIEEMLTEICTTDEVAEKLLADGKSLQGAYKAMEDVARKNQKNNRCCIPPHQAMEIIKEYYGITRNTTTPRDNHKRQNAPIDVLSQI